MKMKRLIAAFLCVCTAAALSSCGTSEKTGDAAATEQKTTGSVTGSLTDGSQPDTTAEGSTAEQPVQTTIINGTVVTIKPSNQSTTKKVSTTTNKQGSTTKKTFTTKATNSTAAGLGQNDFANNSTYKLAWSDEFNGTKLNTADWRYEIGFVRNNEPQCYTKRTENVKVQNGNLVLTAIKEKYTGEDAIINDWGNYPANQIGKPKAAEYTSGSINTSGKRDWKYGVFEMRCKFPDTNCKAAWPAFWTMGNVVNGGYWPKCGEIDIMESYGTNRAKYGATMHWYDDAKGQYTATWKLGNSMNYTHTSNLSDEWHVIGMEWDAQQIRFYCDDKTVGVQSITDPSMDEFHRNHYAMFDLALTSSDIGKTSAADFPFDYLVDYVRIYQKK